MPGDACARPLPLRLRSTAPVNFVGVPCESRNRGCHVDCGNEGCMRCFGSYLVWPELREHFLRRLEQGPLGTHLITRGSQHNRTCLIPVSGTGTIRFRLGSLCFANACPELYIVLSSQESRIAVTGHADSSKALALCHTALQPPALHRDTHARTRLKLTTAPGRAQALPHPLPLKAGWVVAFSFCRMQDLVLGTPKCLGVCLRSMLKATHTSVLQFFYGWSVILLCHDALLILCMLEILIRALASCSGMPGKPALVGQQFRTLVLRALGLRIRNGPTVCMQIPLRLPHEC